MLLNLENNCYASARLADVASNLMRKGYIVETQLIDTVDSKYSTYDCKKNPIIRIKYLSKYRSYIMESFNNEFNYIKRLEIIKISKNIYSIDEILNSPLIDYEKGYFIKFENYLKEKDPFNKTELDNLLRQEKKYLEYKLNNIGKITYEEFPIKNSEKNKFLYIVSIFFFLSIFFVLVFYSLSKLSVIKLK